MKPEKTKKLIVMIIIILAIATIASIFIFIKADNAPTEDEITNLEYVLPVGWNAWHDTYEEFPGFDSTAPGIISLSNGKSLIIINTVPGSITERSDYLSNLAATKGTNIQKESVTINKIVYTRISYSYIEKGNETVYEAYLPTEEKKAAVFVLFSDKENYDNDKIILFNLIESTIFGPTTSQE